MLKLKSNVAILLKMVDNSKYKVQFNCFRRSNCTLDGFLQLSFPGVRYMCSLRGNAAPQTHYDTLGLKFSASEAEIKAAYIRLSKLYHPDVNKESNAASKFKNINEAREVLGNPTQRVLYDRDLRMEELKRNQVFREMYTQRKTGPYPSEQKEDEDFEVDLRKHPSYRKFTSEEKRVIVEAIYNFFRMVLAAHGVLYVAFAAFILSVLVLKKKIDRSKYRSAWRRS